MTTSKLNYLELPKCCWSCVHVICYTTPNGYYLFDKCGLNFKTIDLEQIPAKNRMNWCPLENKKESEK